jgi:hypothetical protein
MTTHRIFLLKLLLVGMALATAWAVRGQFGHEHGAAWAGAVGVLTVVALGNNENWHRRLPAIVAIGAVGWGIGGMMSYGRVVGYAKGLDFLNVSYGLLCLFLIGGLYGFLGGGLTGLSLESSNEKKPGWAALLAQMVAGAYLVWGTLIYQLEWFMTPPRSELWAACLGAALALAWYIHRNAYQRSLKIALFAGLGAGFGFAFGNFLQVVGNNTRIDFNWWNVMEYTLGFFGGLGMAYGIFSEKWDKQQRLKPDKVSNIIGWVFLVLLLPMTNLIQAFSAERLVSRAKQLGVVNIENYLQWQYALSWGSLLLIGGGITLWLRKYISGIKSWPLSALRVTLAFYLGWYILLSNLIGAIWIKSGDLKEYLYWVNLALITWGVTYCTKENKQQRSYPQIQSYYGLWIRLSITTFFAILFLSLVLINAHNGLPGAQTRFVWE